MLNINQYITEAAKGSVLHFDGMAPAALFLNEFSGQISDGKYENARPSTHWEWVVNSNIIVDGNEYYEGRKHRINYSFSDFVKYAKDALADNKSDYNWAIRILGYGKIARVFENMNIKVDFNSKDAENIIKIGEFYAIAQYYKNIDNYDDFKTFLSKYLDGFYEDRIANLKENNENVFNEFIKTKYDIKDLKNDINSMCATINTNIKDF